MSDDYNLQKSIAILNRNLDEVTRALARIPSDNNTLNRIERKVNEIMADLSALQSEVENNNNATQSAIALINGLSDRLDQALADDDPAAVQSLVEELRANSDALSSAVTANTPAAAEAPAETPAPDAGTPAADPGEPIPPTPPADAPPVDAGTATTPPDTGTTDTGTTDTSTPVEPGAGDNPPAAS